MKKLAGAIKLLIKLGIIAVIFGILFSIGVFAYFAKDLPDPDVAINQGPAQSTRIYDRTGEVLLFEVAGEQRRTVVDLQDIPLDVRHAFIAIEDDDFYHHIGIDLKGIIRAVLANLRSGGISQGGSTITQQFIKNSLLTTDQTFTRKIKEIILALLLERRYTKDEILGFYLNQIPFGSNVYGVETAAQHFFAKSVNELTIAEAALLAAIPQAPTFYSPYGSHPEELEARKELVLKRMHDFAYISEDKYKEAIGESIEVQPQRSNIKAPHFVMYVIEQLEERFGKEALQTEGFNVITTLDYDLQIRAEQIVANRAQANERNYDAHNAALLSLDPRNGEILAMVGSRDFFDIENDGQVNVTIRDRQPGSSFKPFAYAQAFIEGYTPQTILFDVQTQFPGGDDVYAPENYNGRFSGPVSMRQALARSLNIPAVKTLYLAGVNETIDLAERLGITTLEDRSRFGLSLVLGGGEIKLIEMAAAYGAFANEGSKVETTPILSITDSSDTTVEWNKDKEDNRVLDVQIARTISDVLSDNASRAATFGTSNLLTIPGRQVAAKTGTTNRFRDAWTIGFTPSLVTGVWVGNNNNDEMRAGAAGSVVAAPIWNEFMRTALADLPVESFVKPDPIEADKPMLNGRFADEQIVRIDSITGKLATPSTPPNLIEERVYAQVHNILHYISRSDPLGPIPSSSQRDPRYQEWEVPVQEWVSQQPASAGYNQSPPTELDDIHTDSNRPVVTIISPRDGASVKTETIVIKARVDEDIDVQQIDFFLDGEFIGSDSRAPYEVTARIPQTDDPMDYIITAKVFDENFNQSGTSIVITTGDTPLNTGLFEVDLDPITDRSAPYRITFTVGGGVRGGKASVYYAPIGAADDWEVIKKYASVSDGRYSFRWRIVPDSGVYSVFVVVEDGDGRTLSSRERIVDIQ